jgi:hypothetical protein
MMAFLAAGSGGIVSITDDLRQLLEGMNFER